MQKYSKEFVDKCKELYPHHKELHNALDDNSDRVGLYLECGNPVMSVDVILESNSLDELKKKALLLNEKAKVFNEYNCRMYSVE